MMFVWFSPLLSNNGIFLLHHLRTLSQLQSCRHSENSYKFYCFICLTLPPRRHCAFTWTSPYKLYEEFFDVYKKKLDTKWIKISSIPSRIFFMKLNWKWLNYIKAEAWMKYNLYFLRYFIYIFAVDINVMKGIKKIFVYNLVFIGWAYLLSV